MIRTLIATPIALAIVVMLLVFGEMFVAKKAYVKFTQKIVNPTVRRAVNMAAGVAMCFALAWAQIAGVCDFWDLPFHVWTVVVAALGATGLYIIIEKIFGEAKVNELGKTMVNVLSHSDMFDGELTAEGVGKFTKKLLNVAETIDKEVASKQDVAVEKAVDVLEGFLKDGKITAEEKAQADVLLKDVNLEGNDTYKKYQALLNK